MNSSHHQPSPHELAEPAVDPVYLDWLWTEWQRDPNSITEDWQQYFNRLSTKSDSLSAPHPPPLPDTLIQPTGGKDQTFSKLEKMIQAFRSLGHLSAHLNPLAAPKPHPDYLKPAYYGLTLTNQTTYPVPGYSDQSLSISEVYARLKQTYTQAIGADYAHLQNPKEKLWLECRMEACTNRPELSKSIKHAIFEHLAAAEGFEKFLHRRYLGKKRFSLEGLDALIPLLHFLSDYLSGYGSEELCLGMAHRGRLSVLVNFMGKPMEHLIRNFEETEYNPFDIDGDVKYHLGYANTIRTFSQHQMSVYLAPNPSHLESVGPVIKGFVKGRQRLTGDTNQQKVVPLLLHGDSSFCGQGVVTEMLNLSKLNGYSCGGSLHIILNNQVGFTTSPHESRSCHYATDLAKFIDSPILHVNADDPEACIWAAELACSYRHTFHKDFFIDLIGYRRHGHNESDEPAFTQPLMYQGIKQHPTVLSSYSDSCIHQGILTAEEIAATKARITDAHQQIYTQIKHPTIQDPQPTPVTFPDHFASALHAPKVSKHQFFTPTDTTVNEQLITTLITTLTTIPADFNAHPKITKVLKSRAQMLTKSIPLPQAGEARGAFDWDTAELLALGTLAYEGHHVRLTGQDVRRGTFSSRHATITDTQTGHTYEFFAQLNNANGQPVSAEVINSPLSELGCLGFEYGYSVADPQALVLWEAQFGDFANGAQIIIDQFLAASEAKWQQAAACVMLLPHGYEGQGPEHSSARLERYLQLCGGGNLQVVGCSTPAQHFHVLRRQMKRDFRKCLIAMTPKSLLRDPMCLSSVADICGSSFQEVLDDPYVTDDQAKDIRHIILCSGKVTYDAFKYRLKRSSTAGDHPAIIRLEQLYPFPATALLNTLKRYPQAQQIIWLQEEPQNMGAWSYVRNYLEETLSHNSLTYVGRKASGSTAEGSKKAHLAEQDRIIKQAFGDVCHLPPPRKSS